ISHLLKQHGPFTVEETIALLRGCAAALDHAHGLGFVHRDIKPSNIMVRALPENQSQEAVLMDFGIAKIREAQTKITNSGPVGTIGYMAHEQILEAKEFDHHADIYALAVTAYEMLANEGPFKGNVGQMVFAHLQQPPPNVSDIRSDVPRHVAHAIIRA